MAKSKARLMATLLVAFSLLTGKASANTVSYDLTGDPNLGVWAGVPLARVTLMDVTGGVDFTVEPLISGTRLSQLGFNFLNDIQPAGFAITGLTSPWNYTVDINNQTGFNGFGKFDVDVNNANMNAARLSLLTFSVTGGTIADYVAASTTGSLFSVHVTDLNSLGGGSCSPADVAAYTCTAVTGYAGGGTVVPVPAAVWLFGSGLLGLAGVARRKRNCI